MPARERRGTTRGLLTAVGVAGALGLLFGYLHLRESTIAVRGADAQGTPVAAQVSSAPATFVGAAACANCHAAQFQAWRSSQHQRAMQTASRETVLAPFAG